MSWSDFFSGPALAALLGPFIGFLLGQASQIANLLARRIVRVILLLAVLVVWSDGAKNFDAQRAAKLAADDRDQQFREWQVQQAQLERENRQLAEEVVRRTRWLMRAQAGSPHERAVQAAKNFGRVVDRIRRRDIATSGGYRDVPFETLTRRIDTQFGRSHAKCMKAGIVVVASIPGLPGTPGSLLSPVEFCTNVLTMEEAAPRLMALAEAVR